MTKKLKKSMPLAIQCPCCDFFTFKESASGEVCPVCFWENADYGFDQLFEPSAANDGKTLDGARRNFQEIGACGKEWLNKVCSVKDRLEFKRKTRDEEVELLRLISLIEAQGIPAIREGTECPQCEWGEGGNYLFAPGAKGYVVYDYISYSKHLKLWSASPPAHSTALQEQLIQIAKNAGYSLQIANTENNDGWIGTRFAVTKS